MCKLGEITRFTPGGIRSTNNREMITKKLRPAYFLQLTMVTPDDVLLYVPNLIGYGRVLCTLASFGLMIILPNLWSLAIVLYVASFVGDLFDGMFARKFHQTSSFGGMLDMVTDRCSTMGLLFVLSGNYMPQDVEIGFPAYRLTFLGLALLDISSHWCQMYSTSALKQHHKSKEGNVGRNFLVRWFYQYYYFFGYLCVGAEFTYIFAYVMPYMQQASPMYQQYIQLLLWICLPGCILKQLVNIMQLSSACYAVAKYDADAKNG